MIEYSRSDLRKKIILPKKLTPELAELCGVHIGDGYLGFRKEKQEYLVQCSGHLQDDRAYYDQHLSKLWKSLFNVEIIPKARKDNTYEIRVYSKAIATFFHQFLQLPYGKKARTITFPKVIKDSCKEKISPLMVSCIRGVIDTDFYFVLDRTSPELGAWFASKPLVNDLYFYLQKLGLQPTKRVDVHYYNKSSNKMLTRHQLRIRKKKDIRLWFALIGTNNPKFYKRYHSFFEHAPVV